MIYFQSYFLRMDVWMIVTLSRKEHCMNLDEILQSLASWYNIGQSRIKPRNTFNCLVRLAVEVGLRFEWRVGPQSVIEFF